MRRPWALAVLLLAPPAPALARSGAAGPAVSAESSGKAEVEPSDKDSISGKGAKVARRRYDANLVAPVPLDLLGGMFVLKADLFQEERDLDGPATAPATDSLSRPNAAGYGAIFLPHAQEGAPRFFLAAERYGPLAFAAAARPMTESIAGAVIAAPDLPFNVKIRGTDTATTRVQLRYRQFPGFHTWQLAVGWQVEQATGWYFDLAIPEQVLVGWETPDEDWSFYGGVRWTSRTYPFAVNAARGWADGLSTARLLGIRRELWQPLYVALEAGMEAERLRFVDEQGDELEVHQTAFAPWIKVTLATWIRTP